jgi:alpha-L-fucosidase 2
MVRVASTDGDVWSDGLRLYVRDATTADIVVTAVTNYEGYQKPRSKSLMPLVERCGTILDEATAVAPTMTADGGESCYDGLRARHIEKYREMFDRFSVSLSESKADGSVAGKFPTSDRLRYFQTVADPSLSALVMQYARYLLISASQPGTQPMNLQGIWNPDPCPMWASNYTTNINVQMCYWAADALNLGETTEPLTRMMKELAHSGARTAKEVFDAHGWVVHHNTDLWRMTEVAGEDASWAWWPTAGLWLVDNLWQHYLFTNDEDYLEEIFPIITGAVDFIDSIVIFDEEEGCYVTAMSTSPENKFIVPGGCVTDTEEGIEQRAEVSRYSPDEKDLSCVSKMSTLDVTMMTDVLEIYRSSCGILGRQVDPKAMEVLDGLPPFRVGRYGQLQEWEKDFDECTPGMPHLSHLVGVYPESIITPERPELFKAARVAFERRTRNGAMYGQWPGAWNLCMNARFKDATSCYMNERYMGMGLGASFLSVGTLQIDAVMGWAAGLSEMILQSHMGYHDLLPAIPSGWRSGDVEGIRARGGVEYSIHWSEGCLTDFTVTADDDCTQEIRYGEHSILLDLRKGQPQHVVVDAENGLRKDVCND